MKRKLTMMLLCMAVTVTAWAQTAITGTVVSATDDEPIIGATVKIKGAAKGVITDINGKFTIDAKAGTPLVISYVGMQTVEAHAKNNMLVRLGTDEKVLDEVMVIAYGTQKKSAFTGSAAVVDSKEIGKVQVTNAVDALKGKASGVQINTASGQPGSTPSIRIRGINSINSGSAPLIVVDGSPYGGSLNDINPADVESMTVLKDAASTALYGARGGNGVILITTKAGKRGQDATITFDAKWGSNSKAVPEYETIKDPAGYYETWYRGITNYGMNKLGLTQDQAWAWANENLTNTSSYGLGYNVYTIPEGQMLIGKDGKLNPNATLGRISTTKNGTFLLLPDDWEDEMYNNSLRQEYTMTATGSSDRGTFYASANYLSNDGITKGSDYKRFTGRLKADYQVKSWLKMSGNMTYGHYNYNSLGDDGDGSSSGNIFAFVNAAPIYPLYIRDANGNIIYDQDSRLNRYDYGEGYVTNPRPFLTNANPLSDNQLNVSNVEGNTFNGSGTAQVTLPYGFTFTSINNVYLNESRATETTNPFFGSYANNKGMVTKEHERSWSYNFQQRVNWHQQYGKHDIEVMLGHEYYRSYGYDLYASRSNQFSVDNTELAGAVVMKSGNSTMSEYNTESWLSRAMYNFDDRYFASVSLMRQASSRFHKDSWWGTFWSFGAGWLINKEKFFNVDWVDELKFKASYGENGNDQIGSYQYTKYYDIVNSNDEVSLIPSSLGNPGISWEKNGKFNMGFDFSFLNHRIWGGIEYYNNRTTDMLSWVPLPPSYGWSGYYDNVGNMINNGVEIDLHVDVISTRDFTWNVYANLTTNHNEITKLSDERKKQYRDGIGLGYSSGSYFYQEGQSRYTYFSRKYGGVYNEDTYKLTYGPDVDEGDMVYDASKAGMALYYKNVYEKYVDEQGNSHDQYYDLDGNKVDENYTGVKKRNIIGQILTEKHSEADDYLLGDMMPDVYGGFGTAISYKGFDFSADFQYQIGGQIYDSSYASLMNMSRGQAMHVDILDAWSTDNPNSCIPRLQYNDQYMASSSDRFLVSASYLTLANITVGYTFSQRWLKNLGLQKIRLYAVADNIWTWSKRQGLDPRQSIAGGNSNAYYRPVRTVSGGITVTF
ncbi:MAG: SusC/RagA family TonB-linked outer membrane protein [Prevotella sp.]